MVLVLIVCAACISLLIYYFSTMGSTFWEKKKIPYEKPFLFFGSMYSMVTRKEHLLTVLRRLYEKYKNTPYFGIHVFTKPTLVIRDPQIIKRVLVKDFDKFANRSVTSNEDVDPVAFHALFTAKGGAWRAVRSKISPVFTSGKLKLMLPLMQECGDNLVEHLAHRKGATLEFRQTMKKYAVDVISSCAFGINSYGLKDENSEIQKMANRLLDQTTFTRSFAALSFFFIPKFVSLFRIPLLDQKAQNFLLHVFNSTLNERENNGVIRNDLIDLLNTLRKSERQITEGYVFDDIKMAAQALSFFSAGNDTTSLTISFCLYELALHRHAQSRLREEVKAKCQDHQGFTYEALQDMRYLDMVLNETLRKYPLTMFLNREANADYIIEETGFKIEKGTSIMIPVGPLHFDPEYFPKPDSFDPERFSDENKSNIAPYTFMPFGEGPRNCIGQRFGLLASKVALAYIIKDFAVEITAETQVPIKFSKASLFLQDEHGIFLKIVKV